MLSKHEHRRKAVNDKIVHFTFNLTACVTEQQKTVKNILPILCKTTTLKAYTSRTKLSMYLHFTCTIYGHKTHSEVSTSMAT